MIKKIRNWTSKSYKNNKILLALTILTCQMACFMPYMIFLFHKYGFGTIPIYHVFIEVGLIFLSIWIGYKIAIKILYGKEK